jgi:hypothetical protein
MVLGLHGCRKARAEGSRRLLLVGMGLIVITNVTMYVLLYMPTFANVVLKIPQSNEQKRNTPRPLIHLAG